MQVVPSDTIVPDSQISVLVLGLLWQIYFFTGVDATEDVVVVEVLVVWEASVVLTDEVVVLATVVGD